MKRGDLWTGLERAREQLDEAPLPAGLKQRLSERTHARTAAGPSRRPLRATAVALATVCAASLAIVWLQQAPAPAPTIPGMTLEHARSLTWELETDGTLSLLSGAATLHIAEEGVRIETTAPVRLLASRNVLLLREGRVRLTVEPRGADRSPFRVEVSHGRIEVLGTTFDVVQHEDGGTVTLHEGRIRFVALDERTRALSPGETLSWPLPQEPEPESLPPVAVQAPVERPPPREKKRPKPEPPAPVEDELFEQLESLRAAGSLRDAAALISRALDTPREPPLEAADRERLSFELGTLLGNHLDDRAGACARWTAHQQAFPDGRYRAEVERAQRAHGCDTPEGNAP